MSDKPHFESKIWLDESQLEDPFTAKQSFCHGFDVFGQLIKQASFSEYILLLFLGEKPTCSQTKLFEALAVSYANLGPRDASVRAAMNSGVGGAPAASSLIAALAVGAGQTGGCREIFILTHWFHKYGTDLKKWENQLKSPNSERLREDIWDEFKHPPGFKSYGVLFPHTLQQLLDYLSSTDDYPVIQWLTENRSYFEQALGAVMAHTFIAAAVFYQLGFAPEQAEICALIIMLPGAAVHSLEAKKQGWRKFPFFGQSVELLDDPGVIAPLPDIKELNI